MFSLHSGSQMGKESFMKPDNLSGTIEDAERPVAHIRGRLLTDVKIQLALDQTNREIWRFGQ